MSDVDLRELQSAVKWISKEAKKDGRDYLNKYLLQVIIGAKGVQGAIKRTPKAVPAKIRAAYNKVLRMVLWEAKKKKQKLGKREAEKKARAIINRRLRARAYTAGPGWHKAAVGLGGRGVRLQGGFNQSKASRGKARKATVSSLVAEIENAAPAASKIGTRPLQEAADAVVKEAVAFWENKTQKTFDNSAR